MIFLSLLLLLIFPLGCCYCYCVRSKSTTTLHDITNHANDVPFNPSISEMIAVDEGESRMIPSQTHTNFDRTHAVEGYSSQTHTNFDGTHAVEGYSSELAVAEIIVEGQEMISDHHFILTPFGYNCQRARYPTDEELGSSSPALDLHADIILEGDENISHHHFLMASLECQRARYPTDLEIRSSSPAPDFDVRIVHL